MDMVKYRAIVFFISIFSMANGLFSQQSALSWDFTSAPNPNDTLAWTAMEFTYVPTWVSDDDNSESGYVKLALNPDYDREYWFLESGSNGLNGDLPYVGYRTQAGELSAYYGGTLNFRFNEHFDGNWNDTSRIPDDAQAYVYLDGYVGGEYVLLGFSLPYKFDDANDTLLSLTLSPEFFQNLNWTYVWPDLGDIEENVVNDSPLTPAQFGEFLAGEVGIFFRMAANEASYVGSVSDPITYLKEVYFAQVPEPADFAAALGILSVIFAVARRRK